MKASSTNETFHVAVTIPLEHPAYKDHFPDVTIVPGVVILEQVLTACAVKGLKGTHIKSCKFLKRPPPGLKAELTITRRTDSGTSLELKADNIVYLRAALS